MELGIPIKDLIYIGDGRVQVNLPSGDKVILRERVEDGEWDVFRRDEAWVGYADVILEYGGDVYNLQTTVNSMAEAVSFMKMFRFWTLS